MVRSSLAWVLAAGAGALFATFAGCARTGGYDDAPSASVGAAVTPALPARFERQLSWGSDVVLRPAAAESIAQGPSAVAVLPSGEALILDRLGGRVLAVDHASAPRTLTSVPKDVEELASGGGGAFVAFSALRARAWFFGPTGNSAGELAVPRELRDLVRLSVGPSRRLVVHTSHQESLVLGSPAAPLPLEVTLAGKREGAHELPDGRGVAARATGGGVELVVLSQPRDDEKSRVEASHALPGSSTAARVVGAEGSVVCLRTERVTSTPTIAVERRAVCVDALSGSVLFDEALPEVGLYLPRTELAFGAGRLAFIHPEASGLVLKSWRVLEGEEVQP